MVFGPNGSLENRVRRAAYDAPDSDTVLFKPAWNLLLGADDETRQVINRTSQWRPGPGLVLLRKAADLPALFDLMRSQVKLEGRDPDGVCEHITQQEAGLRALGGAKSWCGVQLLRQEGTDSGEQLTVGDVSIIPRDWSTTKLGIAVLTVYSTNVWPDELACVRAMGYTGAQQIGARAEAYKEQHPDLPMALPLSYIPPSAAGIR